MCEYLRGKKQKSLSVKMGLNAEMQLRKAIYYY